MIFELRAGDGRLARLEERHNVEWRSESLAWLSETKLPIGLKSSLLQHILLAFIRCWRMTMKA